MINKVAVVFTQASCNMNCLFCVTEETVETLTWSQSIFLLEYLKTQQVRFLVLGGGEPFTWPGGIVELTQEAKAMGFFVQIGTNGINLPDGFETINSIDRYVLPIESHNSDIHNKIRFYKKRHHQIILERLNSLKNNGKSVTLSTVVTSLNYKDMIDLAYFLLELYENGLNIHAWHIYQFLAIGRGGACNAHILKPPEAAYNQIVNEICDLVLPFKIFRRINMYSSQTIKFYWFEQGQLKTSS